MGSRQIKAVHGRRVSVALEWKPADLWVGAYVDGRYWEGPRQQFSFYVCLVPCLPIHFTITMRSLV